MGEYFLGITLTVLVCGFIISLLPDRSSGPYLRLICGAAVILSVLAPLVAAISDGGSTDGLKALFEEVEYNEGKYEEIYNDTILSAGAEECSKSLENTIGKDLSIDTDGFDVSVIAGSESDEIYISRVEVIIYPSGLAIDPHMIEKYVSERLGCECIIFYE